MTGDAGPFSCARCSDGGALTMTPVTLAACTFRSAGRGAAPAGCEDAAGRARPYVALVRQLSRSAESETAGGRSPGRATPGRGNGDASIQSSPRDARSAPWAPEFPLIVYNRRMPLRRDARDPAVPA